MQILPNKQLSNIPTGNQYIGRNGFVDLAPTNSTVDVAEYFPNHEVDVGWRAAATNIRSHLLGRQIRVFYHENNLIKEIEILAPDSRLPEMKLNELFLCGFNVFDKTLLEIAKALEASSIDLIKTDVGFDLADNSVAFYSNEFEEDLDVKLDTVVLRFS